MLYCFDSDYVISERSVYPTLIASAILIINKVFNQVFNENPGYYVSPPLFPEGFPFHQFNIVFALSICPSIRLAVCPSVTLRFRSITRVPFEPSNFIG